MKKILELCLENGATLAEPGEFTKRAFLNGRIDLLQAESVIDVINAKTEKSLKLAQNQLSGKVSDMIHNLRQEMLDVIANIAVNEVIVCVISRSPILCIAPDNISNEVAIDIITTDDFTAELLKLPILEYNLLATNNCANNPPTAANDVPNLSESINDILTIEAAKIPIAAAILINISAFNLS